MKRQSPQQPMEALKARLAEAEDTLRAIYHGEVDALVVSKPEGNQIFTLEGAEKPHRLLVEAMNEGAMTLNAGGTILYCNARLADMLKKPIEQVMGSSWRQLLPPEEHSSFKSLLGRAKKKGVQGKSRLITSKGKLLPVHVSASTMNLLGTDVFAILLTDISAIKTAEKALCQANQRLEKRIRQRTSELTQTNEALKVQSEELSAANEELQAQTEELRVQAEELRNSEQLFRSLFENAFDAVLLSTPNGKVQAANPAACTMFSMSEDEICRLGRVGLIDSADPRNAVMLEEFRRSGKIVNQQGTYIRKDRTRFPAEVSSVLFSNEPPRSFIIIRDISERKRTEESLAEAQRALQHHATNLEHTVHERTGKLNEMVDELEHFSYAITHDMRAPLRAMHGLSKLLLSECCQCEHADRRDILRRIADAATRMDSLITDSLNYSKVASQQFDLEPVDVKALLEGVIETYPEFYQHKANIKIEGDIPMVRGNKAGLTQCFSNLLGNAVKFVQPGKVPHVRVWAETQGEYVRLNFKDNGIGIAKEYQQQIWDMFQILNKEYEGTGIGLALVRKVVHRMEGHVGVVSEPGKGSCFWLELKPHTI